ncbi:periplasmic solute binding protein [Sulfurihydrogenibium sp. YO3AOP1]|uniref:metal ABC transporter substrate-binding protein n=1 Tax=Sulfurihydrogenibium sp. (strain YO3AOP1) TaxID=436114 RepID=UPI0001724E25|nr:zinc ABC transporter substrate-binding protein [Sulfurihydrogenibium sp. YO3AOP1]ACD67146.1 periplasmic solute binding protein [Sulfurihydrogenibium sp. YO3AOP1]
MRVLSFLLILLTFGFAEAEIKVVATYPYIASITKEIVKEKAQVDYLASGNLDPHFIVPKPSLTVKLRNADLLIINGAGLEVGWLPPLLNQANNRKINPGSNGFLDLSQYINLIEKLENVSRVMGDVHPEGNPHFHLDPYNVLIISQTITEKLCKLDSSNCDYYKNNLSDFKKRWNEKLAVWNSKMANLKGVKVYQYHKLFDYFLKRYGIISVDTIEPLPGIPPTAKHLEELISKAKSENVKMILQDVYHPIKPAKYLSEKTGLKIVVLPHDVGTVEEAKDIFSLFDTIVERMNK